MRSELAFFRIATPQFFQIIPKIVKPILKINVYLSRNHSVYYKNMLYPIIYKLGILIKFISYSISIHTHNLHKGRY